MYCGFSDSLKGAMVLFYMDKQINERIYNTSFAGSDYRKKDTGTNQSPLKTLKKPRLVIII